MNRNNRRRNSRSQVPQFNQSNENLDSIVELQNLRISENQSAVSNTTANSNDLALLINLDEILGAMTQSDSFRSTPHPSRQQTPAALSEADPGIEIEVRAEDLGTYDVQGVNWSNFSVSREDYRTLRIKEYQEFERNRRSTDDPHHTLGLLPKEDDPQRVKHISPLGPIVSFRYMNKADSLHIPHFQLRHLLCCPTIRTVIFPHYQRIKAWNPVSNQSEVILNTAEFGTAFSKTSVIAATPEHLFVGGFSGELVIKSLTREDAPAVLKNYSTDPNCITNHVAPLQGDPNRVYLSCNDCTLRQFDLTANRMRSIARFPYALNAAEANSANGLLAVVGDSRKVRLLDSRAGAEVACLSGHADFCFSVSWHPEGKLIASASQDHSVRIFDIRMLSRELIRSDVKRDGNSVGSAVHDSTLNSGASQSSAVHDNTGYTMQVRGNTHQSSSLPTPRPYTQLQSRHTISAEMAPFRRVSFSPDGSLLALMEADDFVHLYSTQKSFSEGQIVDFFGEIAGVAWDPEGDVLYVGCAGMENGGIMEFRVKSEL